MIYIKNIFISIFIGLFTGIVGTTFFKIINFCDFYKFYNNKIIFFLPVFGIFIIFLYKISKIPLFYETKDVVSSVEKNNQINPFLFVCIYLSSVLTHLSGGSSGKESASIQLGASFGEFLYKIFKFRDRNLIIITSMVGMMTAVFTFPITSLFFVLEMFPKNMFFKYFFPCFVSAITSKFIIKNFGIKSLMIDINTFYIKKDIFIKLILLIIFTNILGILFCYLLEKIKKFFIKYLKNSFLIIFIGGIIIVFLTFFVKSFDYNGLGFDIIKKSFTRNIDFKVFLLKILFTVFTLGSGYKGGEVVPIMFIGATFGNSMSKIIGLDMNLASLLGILSIFSISCKKLFSGIFLGIEMFGFKNFLLYLIIIFISNIFYKGFFYIKNNYVNNLIF